MTKKRVLISGAGVAGMACAILLDKEKYDIEIIEQANQFRNIGFSIILWKSGFQRLISLLNKNAVITEEGKDFFKVDGFKLFGEHPLRLLRQFDSQGYAWAIKRERLMEIMENALRKQIPEQALHFSRSIRHIQYQDETSPARVVFRDGEQKEYDIIVIAEGVHSSSRELVAINERIVSDPYALRYAWFDSPTNLGNFGGLFFVRGQLGVIHPPYFKNLLGFYFDKGTPENLQQSFEHQVTQCIKQPSGTDSHLDTNTSDVFELKDVHLDTYCTRNVVVVGDAAHGRPPTLGFGTSLALEDATLLSKKLNALDNYSPATISATLVSYSNERIPRVEKVYRLQQQIQRFYTKNNLIAKTLAVLAESFLGSYFERKMKKIASFEV